MTGFSITAVQSLKTHTLTLTHALKHIGTHPYTHTYSHSLTHTFIHTHTHADPTAQHNFIFFTGAGLYQVSSPGT